MNNTSLLIFDAAAAADAAAWSECTLSHVFRCTLQDIFLSGTMFLVINVYIILKFSEMFFMLKTSYSIDDAL